MQIIISSMFFSQRPYNNYLLRQLQTSKKIRKWKRQLQLINLQQRHLKLKLYRNKNLAFKKLAKEKAWEIPKKQRSKSRLMLRSLPRNQYKPKRNFRWSSEVMKNRKKYKRFRRICPPLKKPLWQKHRLKQFLRNLLIPPNNRLIIMLRENQLTWPKRKLNK